MTEVTIYYNLHYVQRPVKYNTHPKINLENIIDYTGQF